MDEMTVLSKDMFEQAVRIDNIDDAVRVLLSYRHFRTLGDVLRAYTPETEVKKHLVDGLQMWFPDDKKDAIDRKVRNWLNGKTQSIAKEDAYVISRIFGLSLEKTDEFLQAALGEGIHWRAPEEIVWCYGIVHELSPEALAGLQARGRQRIQNAGSRTGGDREIYTAEVREKLHTVLPRSEAEFLDFLEAYAGRLGALHNTAHQLFRNYMDLLRSGCSGEGIEKDLKAMDQAEKKKAAQTVDGDVGLHRPDQITVRDVLELYLYRKLVPVSEQGNARRADAFSAIQKSIRKNWPDEATLSKMEARKKDVSRKVLMMLFLATDGTDSDYIEEDDEEFESADEMFYSIYTRMNLMLRNCGFRPLDPRSPFDWIILFCIASGDLWEADHRLHGILTEMYAPEDQTE